MWIKAPVHQSRGLRDFLSKNKGNRPYRVAEHADGLKQLVAERAETLDSKPGRRKLSD